jgi:hypothetical protein
MRQRTIFSSAAFLVLTAISSGRLLAGDAPCVTNYSTDGKSAETFVLTSLTPQAVVQRLPRLLVQAGVTMDWTNPNKGVIKAAELDVNAETIGEATRVTFRSSAEPLADKEALCRYASLVGNPPVAKVAVAQDAVLIAKMKDDLLKKHQIIQPAIGRGLNNAVFRTLEDFLDFAITGIKPSSGKQEYEISILVPRSACAIAIEDGEDASTGFTGTSPAPRTKPVRVKALLLYNGKGAASHLTDATILSIESTK